jgi:hypothetical protein
VGTFEGDHGRTVVTDAPLRAGSLFLVSPAHGPPPLSVCRVRPLCLRSAPCLL